MMKLDISFDRFNDYSYACDWCYRRWGGGGHKAVWWGWHGTPYRYGITFKYKEHYTEFLLKYSKE